MTLAADLIEQAERLATLEPGEPKQASLRRAVSAAYYGLFHMLTAEAAACVVPDRPDRLAPLVQRTFDHGSMKRVCLGFATYRGSGPLLELLEGQLDDGIRRMAKTFIDLQQARQAADYDMLHTLTREETVSVVADLRDAIAEWRRIAGTPNHAVFLVALASPRLIGVR
jgi:uncharacterized protein (UPF0332 family)